MTTINFETEFTVEVLDDKADAIITVIENYVNTITKLIPTPFIHAGVHDSAQPERRTA